jgi:hypothetical protein
VGLALNTVGVAKGGTGITSASEQGAMLYGSSSSAYVAQAVNPTFKNRIINGGMTIAQRGTAAVSADGSYPVDRWVYLKNTSATASIQQSSTVPTGFANAIALTVTTGGSATSAQYAVIQQPVEGVNISDLSWGTASARPVTLSFWVRASVTGTYCAVIKNDSANAYVSEYSVLIANTWEKKTITVPGPTAGTWATNTSAGFRVSFDLGSGTNYNTTASAWQLGNFFRTTNQTNLIGTTGATFYLTGIQLEAGSVATEFELRPQQVELALCQRYYQRLVSTATEAPAIASGVNISTTNAYFYLKYAQAMRALPTLNNSILGDNGTFLINQVPVYWATTKGTMYYGDNSILMTFGSSVGGLVSGAASVLRLINTGGQGYLELSAEL